MTINLYYDCVVMLSLEIFFLYIYTTQRLTVEYNKTKK